MEALGIIKELIAIAVLIFTPSIIEKFIFQKSKKRKKLDLIQELVDKIDNKENDKWFICELFYQITSSNMNFNDISKLVKDDNILLILYLIQKYKRLYEYKDGKFQHANEFKNKLIRFFSALIPKITVYISGVILIFSAFIFVDSNGLSDKIEFGIYILITSFYFFTSMSWNDDRKLAERLLV